jgi:hypothetical protein
MRNLTTKLACATVCLLLLCTGSRAQVSGFTDQQINKVRELIHDTVQPSIDAINKKIDTLVETIEATHLKPQRNLQLDRVASDYQEPTNHVKTSDDEHRTVIINNYVGCCRPHWRPRWHHCCRHWDDCCRPRWNHCCRPHYHYCRPRGDDP